MSSPVFSGANSAFKPGATINPDGSTVSADELQQHFNSPAATPMDAGRMSYEGVTSKTAAMIILAFILAAPGYMFFSPAGLIVSAIVGMVLGLVLAFKKTTPPALAIIYAGVEGYFLGSLTSYVETAFDAQGAGLQALLATAVTFGVCLTLYRSGKLRYTPKMRKFLLIGGISYLLFSLVNVGMMVFGATDSAWGLRSEYEIMGLPLGVLIGAFAVILACVSLISDFDFIENGVKRGLPAKYEWTAAFGLVVTLVWMYTEFLRIIALLQGRD
ncbi:Bax inhibitor-1/YccA family protein [Demequina sp. B12]|uniref:Bax inhibitor-1/YccA family protein n=1 Tax=Demequina sp. B12 TaxID=2992757 RepID=UPI00237BB663|nr:Bax inhibitor-1/YccA family protein [Demequina sp. B12]MDE0573784.1 Bax inhibitor-1/YccA family protein [Demequina sp. B12]